MNDKMADAQIKKESYLKSKVEELKKVWKIDEAIKGGAYFISNPENLLRLKPILAEQ